MSSHRSWRRSSKRKPRPVDERFADALHAHRAGDLDAAEKGYGQVLEEQPDHAAALSMTGVLALQRGRPADAVPLLRRATELDQSQPGFFLNLGNALRGVEDWAGAEQAYRRALALEPDMAPTHNNLGNVLRDRGELAGAAEAYSRALELDPSFFAAAANLAQVLDRDRAAPDDVLAAHDRALAVARQAGARGPDVANVHNARANLLLAAGRRDEAIAAYEVAIAEDPEFTEAYLNLAGVHSRAFELEAAVPYLRRAIALRPRELDTYKRLAVILRRLERFEEASEVYQAWHQQDPSDPIAAHMANIAGGGVPPDRAGDEYVRREFDDFAPKFDEVLARLEYQAPSLVAAALDREGVSARRDLDVLDAGCGTGLCMAFLRPIARRLVGVDLSSGMLKQALDRGGYDELVEAEITSMLNDNLGRFDVIVAADVLIYFGDLTRLAQGFRSALRAAGVLAVTAEALHGDDDGWALNDGGRYAHGPRYLRRELEGAGFSDVALSHERLRNELGQPVMGWVVTAKVPAT